MRIAIPALFLLLCACQQNDLPRYPNVSDSDARQILADRAAAIQTFSSQCRVKFQRADGQSVELDGIFVMAPPDRMHLRAWKMSQVVMDLTLLPEGLWVETRGDPGRARQILPPEVGAAQFRSQIFWITGGFFADQKLRLGSQDGLYIFHQEPGGDSEVECVVDKATLTAQSYRMLDTSGKPEFALNLSGYHLVGGMPFPARMEAKAPDGSRFIVLLQDTHLNEPLSDQAFTPPPGARKCP